MSVTTAQSSGRLFVLDAARMIAAIGVIIIHCGPTDANAARVVDFALNFCVPFFLLSSLYLFWLELERTQSSWTPLRRRVPRLLWPYAAWSVVYLGARSLKLILRHGRLDELFNASSAWAIIGAGGAAVQLYYLPLLLLALVVAVAVASIVETTRRSPKLYWLWAPSLILLFSNQDSIIDRAATPAARLAAHYLDWTVWMIPLVLTAAVVARWLRPGERRPAMGWLLLVGAVTIDGLETLRIVPYSWRFHSAFIAVFVLGACVLLEPAQVRTPRLWRWITTSFGVYLVHHLFLEAVEAGDPAGFTRPFGVRSLLIVAAGVGLASMVFTRAVEQVPVLARILLGRQRQSS